MCCVSVCCGGVVEVWSGVKMCKLTRWWNKGGKKQKLILAEQII